jgi:hypothetical protein
MPDEALAEGLHHQLWVFFDKAPQNIVDLLKQMCDVAGCELAIGGGAPLQPELEVEPFRLTKPLFWLGKDKPDSAMNLPVETTELVHVFIEPVDGYVNPNMLYNVLRGLCPAVTLVGVERVPASVSSMEAVANEAALDLVDYKSDKRPLRPVKYSEFLSSNVYYSAQATWERTAPTPIEVANKLRTMGLEYVQVPGAGSPTAAPSLAFVLGTGQMSPQVEFIRNTIGAKRIYIDRTALDTSQAAMLKLVNETEPIRQQIYDIAFNVTEGTLSLVDSAAKIPGAFGDFGSSLPPAVRTLGYVAIGAFGSWLLYKLYGLTWGKEVGSRASTRRRR